MQCNALQSSPVRRIAPRRRAARLLHLHLRAHHKLELDLQLVPSRHRSCRLCIASVHCLFRLNGPPLRKSLRTSRARLALLCKCYPLLRLRVCASEWVG